ncbi:MAG: hypothetical protein M0C28_35720 [Candidatus Moduliflexus flocculans]|nr:hypothetical protein [Candidatus Moduliflexus flocculans]
MKIAGTGKCLPATDLPGQDRHQRGHRPDPPRAQGRQARLGPALAARRADAAEDRRPRRHQGAALGRPGRQHVRPGPVRGRAGPRRRRHRLARTSASWSSATSTPEALFPSTACMALEQGHRQEGRRRRCRTRRAARTTLRIPAFDVLAACTSGLYAIDVVRKHLLAPDNDAEYGLALGAEGPQPAPRFLRHQRRPLGRRRGRRGPQADGRFVRHRLRRSLGIGHDERRGRLQRRPRHPLP